MPRSIDHASAQVSTWEVTAGRATCTCGWRGPLRDTEVDARPDRDRHQASHAAVLSGYEVMGRTGVNDFAMHAHGGAPPDPSDLNVPAASVEFSSGRPVRWAHAHDGGARPHDHEGRP